MPEPIYQIGDMDLDPSNIRFVPSPSCTNAYDARHKFVVSCSDGAATVYVSYGSHTDVVKRFGLDRRTIASGGSLYVDSEQNLTLNDFSDRFGRVPRIVRQRLVDILAQELRTRGIEFQATSVKQIEADLEDEEVTFAEDEMRAFLQKYFAD